MKAAQFTEFGGPEVIQINNAAPKPTLKEGQILVENYAASINPFDYKLRSGIYQEMIPVQFPFTIGGDFAGKVVEIASDVKEFSVGDDVFGQAIVLNGGSGTMAEFVAANTKNTALKPKNTNFEEAGALPLVGVSAVQALEDHIQLQSGQKILIQGGAGGIGNVAIQIAKALGAFVATTVNGDDKNFVKALGADEIIDYKSQKFEEMLSDYDAVFDTVGGKTTDNSFIVLKKGGILVSMLGQPNEELAKKYSVTAIGQNSHTTSAHLQKLTTFVESGKVKITVDKTFPLHNIQEAFTFQENEHPHGKVVIKIKDK